MKKIYIASDEDLPMAHQIINDQLTLISINHCWNRERYIPI